MQARCLYPENHLFKFVNLQMALLHWQDLPMLLISVWLLKFASACLFVVQRGYLVCNRRRIKQEWSSWIDHEWSSFSLIDYQMFAMKEVLTMVPVCKLESELQNRVTKAGGFEGRVDERRDLDRSSSWRDGSLGALH
ncbi:hypothetical protein ACFE04_027097 [Oxalis oulophora]